MDPRAVLDDLLEIAVIPSFSRLGPEVRSRLWDWREPPADALVGRTALVTGPTSGLGRAIAQRFAALGARVVLVGRRPDKLGALREELAEAAGADRFPCVVADLSSRASVHNAVRQILASESRLDVLVDNAGALYRDRRESVDGIEATLAVLVVGPFILTAGLQPLLRETSGAQVIAVTSGGMYTQAVRLDDLETEREAFSGPRVYARAKRVQVALIREWARRTRDTGVRHNAMHPGWADTPGLAEGLPGFRRVMAPLLRTPARGVDTVVWLSAAPEARDWNGRLFLDRRPRPFDRVPATRLDAATRRRLWDAVVELATIVDPAPR
ncbi:MAG: SDR family NAD(P)-dependent oxidoreductase [Thermoplasmata archaeon]|nr:SDR family NAD(P)-dependent oxidoreductase [Thermoplasmata archaeon]